MDNLLFETNEYKFRLYQTNHTQGKYEDVHLNAIVVRTIYRE